MSGSEFWKGSDQGEPEAWKQGGHAGSTGNSTRNYEDYLRKLYAEVDRHLKKLREQSQDENQIGRTRHSHANSALEGSENRETPFDSTGGNPYHEEKMKIPGTRRGGQKRLKNPFANGSSSSFSGGTNIAPYSKSVDCPESGCEVCFSECLRCENFQQWHEKDDGLRRCYHEYVDLESRGYYDGTWNDQPGQYTYEEWVQYQEELRGKEVIDSEMEREWADFEREDEEFERRAEEMERKADSEFDEYLKDKYGEYEDDGDHEEEEEEDGYDQDDGDDEDDDHEKENDKDGDDAEDDEEEEEDEDKYGEDDYFDDDKDDGYDYGDGWRG